MIRPTDTVAPSAAISSLAEDVRYYLTLTPRQLPSSALYDRLGSALFDAICELPWYPVTRAERRLIALHRAAIFAAAGRPTRLVELGGGNGAKLRLLLGEPGESDALDVDRIDLIDVSPAALAAAAQTVGEGRDIDLVTHLNHYEDGLLSAAQSRRADDRLAVLFLGSNIGNFDPPAASALLVAIRSSLRPGDALVIGADLVKPDSVLIAAYDDPLGVTAAFNKNLLLHLNAALGTDFDVTAFDHRAVWDPANSRVEMHLVSRRSQHVSAAGAGISLDLEPGEPIWTESSYKYDAAEFSEMLRRTGFVPAQQWIDREGQFLLVAARVANSPRRAADSAVPPTLDV